MTTKFFIDLKGKYLGGYDGCAPPEGAIEVQSPPDDGRQKWDFDSQKWLSLDDALLVAAIKAEAGRRITESGHDWMAARQITASMPVPQTVLDYAAAVRTASAALEANPPLDYTHDKHWPEKIS